MQFDFTEIRFYNLDTNEWYTQQADFINDEKPATRTRFCSVLVREEGTQTWDLWLYGGQSTEDPTKSPNDIWVLTMPAFMYSTFAFLTLESREMKPLLTYFY